MSLWRQADEKFDQLSDREKWMIVVSTFAVVLLLGFTFVFEPMLKNVAVQNKKIKALEIQLSPLQSQFSIYQTALSADPNQEANQQLKQIRQRIGQVEGQFSKQLEQLVAPQSMPMLMEAILSQAGSLELVSMESLPAVNLFANREDMEGADLYQHSNRLTFTGRYQDIKTFLDSLQQLTWQVYWQKMEYQVVDYPKAELILEFYTLSAEEALIRV